LLLTSTINYIEVERSPFIRIFPISGIFSISGKYLEQERERERGGERAL